jgi:hypothetical protein
MTERGAASRPADSTRSVPPPRLRAEVLAAAGRTRQLPPVESARRVGARTAASRRRRYTASTVQVVDGVPGNDVFAVSVEPTGGSKVPTVPRIVTQVPLT